MLTKQQGSSGVHAVADVTLLDVGTAGDSVEKPEAIH